MNDDADLLRRYVSDGDDDAFGEFVRRHLALVYGAALRRLRGDSHRAAEVAQHVFIAAAGRASELARHPQLLGWLHAAARNAAFDQMRRERRQHERDRTAWLANEGLQVGAHATAPLEAEAIRPIIDDALQTLKPADREVVLLRYFRGLAFGEIGRQLGVPENTARMRVGRALEKMQAWLTRRGVTSTAAALGLALTNEAGATAAAIPAGLAASVTNSAVAAGASMIAGSAGVALFGIMNTSKLIVGIAALVSVVGIGTAVLQQIENRHIRSALSDLQRERETLRAERGENNAHLVLAEQRANAAEQRTVELQKEVDAARAAAPVRNQSVSGSVAGSNAVAAAPSIDGMLSNPEYFRLNMQKYRAELGQHFGLLYQQLGLSPDQIAKFEANRTEFQQAMMEVASAAAARGVSFSEPGMNKLFSEAAGELEKDLRSLLGEEGYQRYSKYNRAQNALEIVGTLAGLAYRSDAPLTPSQGERIAQIVIDHTRTVPIAPDSRTRFNETDWSAVATEAQSMLSPSQTAAFQSLVESRKLQAQMSALSRAARATAPTKPGG